MAAGAGPPTEKELPMTKFHLTCAVFLLLPVIAFADASGRRLADASSYNKRGVVYSNRKEYDRAIADFTEAIRLNPREALFYNNRGRIYSNRREYDRAI